MSTNADATRGGRSKQRGARQCTVRTQSAREQKTTRQREQQERLTKELAQAGAALANTEVEWEHVEGNLDKALALVRRIQDAYLDADDSGKRLFNQAIFDFIEVDTNGVVYARFAKPFVALVPEDLMLELEDTEDPDRHFARRGSKERLLVEVMGLEPTTSTLRT